MHQCLRFLSGSSRKGRDHSMQSSKVPDYLIPPAYRKNSLGQDERKNGKNNIGNYIDGSRGGQSLQHFRRQSPYMKARTNNSSLSPHRNRRKPLRQRGPSIRRVSWSSSDHLNAKGDYPFPDIKQIRQLENTLSLRMSEYISRLSGVSSLRSHAEKNAGSNEASSMDYLDCYLQSNGLDTCGLYATEDSYKKIVTDFRALIIGWSEIAESICAAKRMESSDKSKNYCQNVEANGLSTVSLISETDYEDAVSRAERHLESFEAIFRNWINAVSKGKGRREESNQQSGKSWQASDTHFMLGKISSFFGGLFSGSTGPSSCDFDQSRKQADVRMSQNIRDLNINTLLYEHVLLANHSSYCFGREAKEGSTQRSNRLLNRWISLYCLSEPKNASAVTKFSVENEKKVSEKKLFHTVIRQNVDLWTVDGVQRAEDWLGRMRCLQKAGKVNCAPDVDTYNLVLLGFCHLCKLFSHSRSKLANRHTENTEDEIVLNRFVIDGVERVLLELARDEGPRPNIISLNLALNALAKAGRNLSDDTFQRINCLVFKIVGEDKYRQIFVGIENEKKETTYGMEENGYCVDAKKDGLTQNITSKSYIDPNLDTYHWLVDIYSASGDIFYIKQGMTLLRKMIEVRIKEDPDYLIRENRSLNAPASFAPSTGTHNNVLRSLVEKIDDWGKLSNCGHDADLSKTGREVTDLLDSMVHYGSSFPTPVTFLFMLQVWQKTQLPEAGDYAEEILSRMEIMGVYQSDMKKISNAYMLALECWFTAAKAGRSNAAERAFR